jgi:hypothetical protein
MGFSGIGPSRDIRSVRSLAITGNLPRMTIQVFFRWVAGLLVLATAAFTLVPIELRPVTGAPVDLERFAAFAVIGTAFSIGYPKHRLHILVLLIGLIGLLEVAQNIVPSRHGRLPDEIVKTSGALCGVALAMLIERQKRVP